MHSLPNLVLPQRKRKPATRKTKEMQTRNAVESIRSQNHNLNCSPLLTLPPEIRRRIYNYAIACPWGPEVFVGLGSHERVLAAHTQAPQTWGRQDWEYLSCFHSEVTGNTEVVPEYCTSEDLSDVKPFIGPPHGESVQEWKLPPVKEDEERDWPMASHTFVRPFLACKLLYYEALGEFFKNRQFILGSSTYALAWLRRIGTRNARNIRSVRLKIHLEIYVSTGAHSLRGLYWDEVVNRLVRYAPELLVLSIHYEEGIRALQDAQRFLVRASRFPNLRRVDLCTWGLGTYSANQMHDANLTHTLSPSSAQEVSSPHMKITYNIMETFFLKNKIPI